MKKGIIAVLLAVSMSPLVSFAYTDCRDIGSPDACSVQDLVSISQKTFLSTEDRVSALQQALKMLTDKIAALKDPTPNPQREGSICFVPAYDLYIGRTDAETNGEVSKLQLWLKGQGVLLDVQGTGYYGEKTAAAVVRWQKAHGMDFVTVKSGVGKMTRAKMHEACGLAKKIGDPYGTYDLGTRVIMDVSPYRVSAEFHGRFDLGPEGIIVAPKAYIDFGDGTSAPAQKTVCPGNDCYFAASHTYTSAGTYIVTLFIWDEEKRVDLEKTSVVLPGNTYTIARDGASNGMIASFSTWPSSGVAPLVVNFTTGYLDGYQKTANYDIDFGDGTIKSMNGMCSPSHCSINHTYTNSGNYMVTLRKSDAPYQEGKTWPLCTARELGCTPVGTVKVVVQATQAFSTQQDAPVSVQKKTGALTVSVTNGKAPLTVTFSVEESAGGQYIDFGDGVTGCAVSSADDCSIQAYPRTFVHTYMAPGVYAVTASRHLPSTTLGTTIITVTGTDQK